MALKVKVDRILCIGAASCVAVAPNTFEMDSEAKAVSKKKDGSMTSEYVNYSDINDNEENILNAAKSCPVNAIVIVEVDDQGNEVKQIWPET
ncbi:MAG: ferredoxin [Candidatus Levybacteria bacterium]|nr:ferredoxin [Candidatus Levybacteria bacterium]